MFSERQMSFDATAGSYVLKAALDFMNHLGARLTHRGDAANDL